MDGVQNGGYHFFSGDVRLFAVTFSADACGDSKGEQTEAVYCYGNRTHFITGQKDDSPLGIWESADV